MYGSDKGKRALVLLLCRSFHACYTNFTSSRKEKAGKVSLSSTNVGTTNAIRTGNYYDPGFESPSLETDGANPQHQMHTTERKLIAKVDLRVVPLLCLLYLVTFL